MKTISRTKKKRKTRHKAPAAARVWITESGSRAKGLNCCVCLESVSSPQHLGQMIASDFIVHRWDVCGAAAHLSCSPNANKDCKCVSMVGYKDVVHQWAIQSREITDLSEESPCCVATVKSRAIHLFLVVLQIGFVCGVKDWYMMIVMQAWLKRQVIYVTLGSLNGLFYHLSL